MIALTHLEDMAGRLIRNLSKGYRQRVGLAQAILGFPRIIILDEPTVGLDPKQIIEIRDLIRQLAKDHTVILSSHILSEVREVCDRVMIIHKGHLVACDTLENLEEQLAGAGSLELVAKGTPGVVTAVLDTVSGIQSRRMEDRGDGTTAVSLSCDGDIRETLFYAFASARCPLLELRHQAASLEDVFLELTEGDGEEAAQDSLTAAPEEPETTGEENEEEKEAQGNESDL